MFLTSCTCKVKSRKRVHFHKSTIEKRLWRGYWTVLYGNLRDLCKSNGMVKSSDKSSGMACLPRVIAELYGGFGQVPPWATSCCLWVGLDSELLNTDSVGYMIQDCVNTTHSRL